MSENVTIEEARLRLSEAEARRASTAVYSPFVAGFAGACGAGALGGFSLFLSGGAGPAHSVAVIGSLAFGLGALFAPFLGGVRGQARGFVVRWAVMISAWALLWVLMVGFADGPLGDSTSFGPVAGLVGGFFVLMVVAVVTEAVRVRRAQRRVAVRDGR